MTQDTAQLLGATSCVFNTGPATVRWLSIQNAPLLVSLSVFSSMGCAVFHTVGTISRNGRFGGRSVNLRFKNNLPRYMGSCFSTLHCTMVPALGVTSAARDRRTASACMCRNQRFIGAGIFNNGPATSRWLVVRRTSHLVQWSCQPKVVSGFFRAFGLHDPGHNLSDNVLAFRRFGEFAVVLACYTKRWAATSFGKPSAL